MEGNGDSHEWHEDSRKSFRGNRIKNSKPLTTRVWFDTTSTIDTATGTWTTTGDGGSESSGAVEITFSGERGYQKDLPVATAMKLVASGTYSQTSKATIDYDYSTKSELAASGVVTTTGKGTASLSGSSRTWWNGGTGEGKLTAPDGTSVGHTENGDRTSSGTLATDWVFAGGGWQEQQTVLDSSGASKGSFSSSMNRSWNVAGDPSMDGPGTYSEGSFVTSATDSHDYTSSSKLTRTANATGGFAVTGWRTGGGESHGTSTVNYHNYDTREYLKTADVIANDAYDYTGDTWRVDFDAAGMPTVQHSGTLTTKEFYSSAGTDGWSSPPPVVINKQESRPRTELNGAPGFRLSPGRGAFFLGYGNSYDVAGDGYGYDESKATPGAFGGGQAPEATPPEPPSGASVVPKGIASEAANYEARLAELSKPRTVTSGSRPLGSGSANLPTMPTVTTPAVGSLGFEQSDSAPETPTTRAFASLVTSGMSAPVGALAASGSGGFDYDTFSAWAHTGLSVGGAVPAFGIVPDTIDFLFTAAEIPFGKSTTTDLGFAAAGLAGTFLPVLGDGPAAAAKIAARAARNADEALDAGKVAIGSAAKGGLNLFKCDSPQALKAEGWKEHDYFFRLPNQGSPAANWMQNSSRLREVMRSGKPIYDSYIDDAGNLIPTRGFLNAERDILINRGWLFSPLTGAWHPPVVP